MIKTILRNIIIICKRHVVSISIIFFVLLGGASLIRKEILYNYEKHIELTLKKIDNLANVFLHSHSSNDDLKDILKKLEDIRRLFFWGYESISTEENFKIKYISIVDKYGNSIENGINLLSPDMLTLNRSLIFEAKKLISIFPFKLKDKQLYLLFPLTTAYVLNGATYPVEKINYDYKIYSSWKELLPPHIVIMILLLLSFLLSYIVRDVWTKLYQKNYKQRYKHLLENLRSLRYELHDLKSNLRQKQIKTHSVKSILVKSNLAIIKFALKYIDLYKNTQFVIEQLSISFSENFNQADAVYVYDVFTKRLHSIESLFNEAVEIFNQDIQELKIFISISGRTKGIIHNDADYILSLIIISLYGIIKSAQSKSEIRISYSLKNNILIICFIGEFSVNETDYFYPSFIEKSFNKNKGLTSIKINVSSLMRIQSNTLKESGDNVVSLFNS